MNFRISPQKARQNRIRTFVRWCRILFLAVGVLALSYCAAVLVDKSLFQAYETWRFERALKNAPTSPRGLPQPVSFSPASQAQADRAQAVSLGIDGLAGSPLGRIEIDSIGLKAMIMEGVDGRTLRHAVGHFPGTPMPGEAGNIVLSAHRDTFFRGLRNLHDSDQITLTTLHGAFRYAVDSTQVVSPDDTKPLGATASDSLTLITCFPFYFVGPAPKRFILRAHRISE